MGEGRFKGYIIAIALGAALIFGTLRFLGFGVGVSDATALDWSSCEVAAEMTPRGGPLQDIRCDHTNIMFETWQSNRQRDVSKSRGGDRDTLFSITEAMAESYKFSGWKKNNEDIKAMSDPRVINGFLTTRWGLVDITAEGEDADNGKGLLAVLSHEGTSYATLCVSRTATYELCEGAIKDIYEAKETPFSSQFSKLPGGVEAVAAEEPVEEPVVEAEPIKELTAAERMEIKKRGEQLYLTQCASCHNVGMTRAPSAPKMGSSFWRGALSKGTDDLIEAAKAKCKDERDGDEFSHMITEREMAMALQHVLMNSSSR